LQNLNCKVIGDSDWTPYTPLASSWFIP